MINITFTEKELDCLIDHITVDEDIFHQLIKEDIERGDEPSEHTLTMLSILERLRKERERNDG
jgi:hypothetical protein